VKISWLPTARRTRSALIAHIAKESLSAALDQLDAIERQVDNLADHPELGRLGRQLDTRELVIARTSFIVVYRLRKKAGVIEILRVIHGAQRWPPKK
jgi:toxin ParE1/3/4